MIEIDTELIKHMAEKGRRIDNRSFDSYREITIEKNVITSAEGSAKVKIGNTEVVAGVKIDIGTPYPDSPDEGVLTTSAELLLFASPEFEPGPPGEQAIELARVVDRAIRESKSIDFKKLCITANEKVWMVFLDIDVMDDDGNLIDAAAIAGITALQNAYIPDLDAEGKPIYDKKGSTKLPVSGSPVSTTFVKIGSKIMADPNLAESKAADARLTVGTDHAKICSLQKGGSMWLTIEEIEAIVELAEKKAAELRARL